jgi:hypothetical protein
MLEIFVSFSQIDEKVFTIATIHAAIELTNGMILFGCSPDVLD